MDEIFFNKLKERVLPYFKGIDPAHDFMHTERVMNTALKIANEEDVDLEIVRVSVLLHDIGRKVENKTNGRVCHAEKGVELAKQILKDFNYSEDKIEKVCHCIGTHRSRKNKVPESIEARILFDADKIDGMGAIGVGRFFHVSGRIGSLVHNSDKNIVNSEEYGEHDCAYREFLIKQGVIDRMTTKIGRKIAIERWEFMKGFFERLNKEVEGEL